MAVNKTDIIQQALSIARGGRTPEESRIYDDAAFDLWGQCLRELVEKRRDDPNLVNSLPLVSVNVPVVDGVADITGNIAAGVVPSLLQRQSIFPPAELDNGLPFPMVFHAQPHQLNYWLDTALVHYAVKDGKILIRATGGAPGTANSDVNGTLTFMASSIPTASATLPDSFTPYFDDMAQLLADALRKWAQPTNYVQTQGQ